MIRRILSFIWSIVKGCNPIEPDIGSTWADHWKRAVDAKEGFYRVLLFTNGTLFVDNGIQVPDAECVRIDKDGKIFDENNEEMQVHHVEYMDPIK